MKSKKRKTLEGAKNYLKHVAVVTLTVFVLCFLITDCTAYSPALYPSYDPLNPGPEVRANPLGTLEYWADINEFKVKWDSHSPDLAKSYFIVDSAFILWVSELKEEIKKLR